MSVTKRICQPGYQAGRNLHISARTPAIGSRRPRLVPVPGPAGRTSTSVRRCRFEAASRATSRTRSTPSPHRPDGRRAASVEWIVVGSDVEAIMLEYNLIKAHRPRIQHPPRGRQELPVPRRDRRRRVAQGHRRCGAPGARTPVTSARTPTPTRSARRSTCCCGPSRSGPARTRSARVTSCLGRPCLLFHIERCSGPCVGAVTRGIREARRASSWVPRR